MTKRHVRLLCCAAALAAGSAGAQAQEWKQHSYAEDGFAVEFSGPVKIYPTELSPETQRVVVRSTNYLQDLVGDAYIVGATTYVMQEVRFEEGAKGSFAAMNCRTLDYDRPLKVAGARAKEMVASNCGDGSFSAMARYYNVGARRFVESFALLLK